MEKDYNYYMESISQGKNILKEVPDDLKNVKMCLEALKHNIDEKILNDVPKFLRTYDVCLEACKNNHENLYYVPNEIFDKEFCYEVCKANGYAAVILSNNEFVDRNIGIDNYMFLEAAKSDFGDLFFQTFQHNTDDEIFKDLYDSYINGTLDSFKENYPEHFEYVINNIKKSNEFSLGETLNDIYSANFDSDVVEALVDTFDKYLCSECFDLEKLKENPDKLLELMKKFDYCKEPFKDSKFFDLQNYLETLTEERKRELFNKDSYISDKALKIIVNGEEHSILKEIVADSPNTSSEILDTLAKCEDIFVKGAVASNPNTSIETLKILAEDNSLMVREGVSNNSKAREVLNSLLDDLSNTTFEEVSFTSIDDLRKTDAYTAFNTIYQRLKDCKENGIEISDSFDENEKRQFGED